MTMCTCGHSAAEHYSDVCIVLGTAHRGTWADDCVAFTPAAPSTTEPLPWCNLPICPEPGEHRITTGRCLLIPAAPSEPPAADSPTPGEHRMLAGSHEQPGGPECRCGAPWDRWNDKCTLPAASPPAPRDGEVCQCGHERNEHDFADDQGACAVWDADGHDAADDCMTFRPAAPSEPPATLGPQQPRFGPGTRWSEPPATDSPTPGTCSCGLPKGSPVHGNPFGSGHRFTAPSPVDTTEPPTEDWVDGGCSCGTPGIVTSEHDPSCTLVRCRRCGMDSPDHLPGDDWCHPCTRPHLDGARRLPRVETQQDDEAVARVARALGEVPLTPGPLTAAGLLGTKDAFALARAALAALAALDDR